MGHQLVLRRLPSDLGHDVFTKTLSLEDVLVSTVFGALAYGPPAMFAAWLRRFTTMHPSSPGLGLEFWPTNQRDGTRQREPDVFVLDAPRSQALIVEAKRGRMPKTDDLTLQLIQEGRAARATHKGVRLHLLVVSDLDTEPAAFDEVRRLRPRLYSSRMRHTTWVELCGFLREWLARPESDAGHRRMIEDALAVMAKYGRGYPGNQ